MMINRTVLTPEWQLPDREGEMSMEVITSLANFRPGSVAEVVSLQARDLARRRLLELGLVSGTRVVVVRHSPSGDSTAYFIR
ncbi:MAG: ferrous iron transport protein [Clostridia bacterium]|nr:ferrous iron transport protein [Clostridia bacterium]